MKRIRILGISILVLAAVLSFSLNVRLIYAQNGTYSIQNVEHQVQILYSGNVVIRETITLTGEATEGFSMGFPYRYGNYLLKGMAFDEAGILPMDLDVPLGGNHSGFYGVKVTFPEGTPQVFTVIFIFSNTLLTATSSGYSLDFPAYPTFTQDTARCNVNLLFPQNASEVAVTKSDGNVNATSFFKENLLAFTNSPATATFSVPAGAVQPMDIDSISRLITISPSGEIRVVDNYHITNKGAAAITQIHLDVPSSASNVAGKDEFGRILTPTALAETDSVTPTTFFLISSITVGQASSITVEYSLPSASPEQSASFSFNLDPFPVVNCYVVSASLQIIPPEGAHFVEPQLSSVDPSTSVTRQLFQETLEIDKTGVSFVDHAVSSTSSLQIAFDYNPLWVSLRPTIGVWSLAIVGSIIVSIWRRPKAGAPKRAAVPRLSAGLSPDNVRAFTEAYEERTRITQELRILHARAQKGKIPRNYYKSQRKTLELRVNALSKNINQLKENFRSAGGAYANLIRQLDTAENELSKARTKIRNAETQHKTGEMPIEDYKIALAEYQQQKEKLEQQINGILLRLREEIH